jgi:ATP-dependent Lon protease
MKETNERNESTERLRKRSSLQAIAQKLNVHCNKVRVLVDGLEEAQINKTKFSLSHTFYTTTSKVMTKAINNLLETYEALRRDVREFAQIGNVSFENSFPELNINFETYYSVAASLLNLTFQMQLMRLYCYRLLKP